MAINLIIVRFIKLKFGINIFINIVTNITF